MRRFAPILILVVGLASCATEPSREGPRLTEAEVLSLADAAARGLGFELRRQLVETGQHPRAARTLARALWPQGRGDRRIALSSRRAIRRAVQSDHARNSPARSGLRQFARRPGASEAVPG